jgi:hypothetical protein
VPLLTDPVIGAHCLYELTTQMGKTVECRKFSKKGYGEEFNKFDADRSK